MTENKSKQHVSERKLRTPWAEGLVGAVKLRKEKYQTKSKHVKNHNGGDIFHSKDKQSKNKSPIIQNINKRDIHSIRRIGQIRWPLPNTRSRDHDKNYAFIVPKGVEDDNGIFIRDQRGKNRAFVAPNGVKNDDGIYFPFSNLECKPEDIKYGDWVTFTIQKNENRIRGCSVRRLKLDTDQTIIRQLADLFVFELNINSRGDIIEFFESRHHNEQINLVLKRMEKLKLSEKYLIEDFSYVTIDILLDKKAIELMQTIPVRSQLKIIVASDNFDKWSNSIKEIFNSNPEDVNRVRIEEWNNAWYNIDPCHELFTYLPLKLKQKVCMTFYQEAISLITRFNIIEHPNAVYSAKQVYENLDEQDKTLAEQWVGNVEQEKYDAVKVKMLSARGAEKAAMRFYNQLGFKTQDIAIQQLSDKSIDADWKDYDILLDENKPIPLDVKNSRTQLNNVKSYVQHVIPEFKRNRSNNDVIITCVHSPYFTVDEMYSFTRDRKKEVITESSEVISSHTQYNNFQDLDKYILILGVTSFPLIQKLETKFESKYFQLMPHTKELIPNWLLEYPNAFYEVRNSCIKEIENIATLNKWPGASNWEYIKVESNTIPIFLSCKFELDEYWKTTLDTWQVEFYNKLMRNTHELNCSLPVIFLTLFSDFTARVVDNKISSTFSPIGYIKLLFTNDAELINAILKDGMHPNQSIRDTKHFHNKHIPNQKNRPLGLFDPLNIIFDLLSTLYIIWDNRDKINLHKYEKFTFYGAGYLYGETKEK